MDDSQSVQVPLQITCSWTFEEYKEAVLLPGRSRRRTGAILFLAAAALLFVSALPGLHPRGSDGWSGIVLGCGLSAAVVFSAIQLRRNVKRQWKEIHEDNLLTMEFHNTHLLIVSQTGRTEVAWLGFTHFSETDRSFILHQKPNMVLIIPKRVLPDRNEELRTFLWQHVSAEAAARKTGGFPVLPVK